MAVIIMFAIVIACLAYLVYADNFGIFLPETNDQIKRANWGALGDFFGGILNPFFAFFGLIMLLATLVQNQKELALTREEIKRSVEALQDQAQTQEKQRFEGTFFQLLNLHQEIVGSIDLHNNETGHTTSGRDCFKVFCKRLGQKYKYVIGSAINPSCLIYNPTTGETPGLKSLPKEKVQEAKKSLKNIEEAYTNFYKSNQSEVGHYFRSMYNIVKFIHESKVDDKMLYSNLLRSQLSVYELTLLFYNCLSNLGNKKFKPLVEEYALLKGLPDEMLFDSDSHLQFYKKSAFGKNIT